LACLINSYVILGEIAGIKETKIGSASFITCIFQLSTEVFAILLGLDDGARNNEITRLSTSDAGLYSIVKVLVPLLRTVSIFYIDLSKVGHVQIKVGWWRPAIIDEGLYLLVGIIWRDGPQAIVVGHLLEGP